MTSNLQRNLAPVTDPVELPEGPFDLPIDANGLMTPQLRVFPLPGSAGVHPGPGPYDVQVYNADMVLWEETAARHRWPTTMQNSPIKWLTFLAWAAARRTGVIDSAVTWESFLAATATVTDKTKRDDTATPTGPGPGPG